MAKFLAFGLGFWLFSPGPACSELSITCLGTADPTCTYTELKDVKKRLSLLDFDGITESDLNNEIDVPEEPRGKREKAQRKKHKFKKKAKKLVDEEGDEQDEEAPLAETEDGEENKSRDNMDAISTPEPMATSSTTESPPNPDNMTIVGMLEKEMQFHTLKHYSNDLMDNTYPPWTYHGFYSPSNWHAIPPWYFSKREPLKAGKFTGLRGQRNSGISFMEFAEGNGTHSLNCSNSVFPSPLDILTDNAVVEPSFLEFYFVNYETLYPFIMYLPEDGTDLLFVKLIVQNDKMISRKPAVDKGATTGTPLALDRILIHYGDKYTEGSEHRINGKSYGMELQFFFNKQSKDKVYRYWETLESYMMDKDSSMFGKNLLVLSILVEVAPSTERKAPAGKEYNTGMKFLSTAAKEFWGIRNTKKHRAFKVAKKSISMQDFFKVPMTGVYYSYYGSLTHPPCLNNTRYAVFETPIYINHETWRTFLFIPSEFSDTKFIAGNHRPLQTMSLRSNYTDEIILYANPEVRLNLSYTVRKSKRSSVADVDQDYDYYEDLNSTKTSGTVFHPQFYLIFSCFYFQSLYVKQLET